LIAAAAIGGTLLRAGVPAAGREGEETIGAPATEADY
jgi:hypothetical protein